MNQLLRSAEERYREALEGYLREGDEAALLRAYELGREALELGADLLDFLALHRAVLASLLEDTGGGSEAAALARRAGEFLGDALAPFEVALRGYREANAALHRLNQTLEQQVVERTWELRESLESLRRSNEQRRRLLERLVRAQEEERRRIAEDIHDDPIQAIAALGMRLELLHRKLGAGTSAEEFRKLQATVQEAIRRLRRMVFELRPRALDREGIGAALREQLEHQRQQDGLPYELDVRLTREPSPEVRTVLFRVAQEALANVRRHARASKVLVSVTDRDGGVLVWVRDDGVGFAGGERPESAPGHLGLSSMRERVELAGGWLRVMSGAGRGTTVEFWVPTGEGRRTP
ncbi:MAG TPA: ATP-binding protein [Actinomycetota bacterium]|nr:ATP-binding protein [Actinomycetota bacterium]